MDEYFFYRVSLRMNTIASHDQFKPIKIGEDLVMNYNGWYVQWLSQSDYSICISILINVIEAVIDLGRAFSRLAPKPGKRPWEQGYVLLFSQRVSSHLRETLRELLPNSFSDLVSWDACICTARPHETKGLRYNQGSWTKIRHCLHSSSLTYDFARRRHHALDICFYNLYLTIL